MVALQSPLHDAARRGDTEEIRRLLDVGADIDARADLSEDYGSFLQNLTPLMVATLSNDGASAATITFLLSAGADPAATSAGGVTAIWYAAGYGDVPEELAPAQMLDAIGRLQVLLDAGLDPNEMSAGISLLCNACAAGDLAAVALLLERGASVMPVRSPGWDLCSFQIPLCRAAASGSAECVQLLLRAGAEPDLPAEDGTTALAEAESAEVARVLLDAGARWDRYRTNSWEDVLDSVLYRLDYEEDDQRAQQRSAVAQTLLDAGAPLENTDTHSWTRLYRAAFGHHAPAVAFLVEHGASLAPDSRGSTPLHAICWHGEYQDDAINTACERIIRLLVAAGISMDARDDEGRTPLHKATGGDWANVTAVRNLLELGAATDPVDGYGQTPLHIAARNADGACMDVLLTAGADPLSSDANGQTAVDLALQHYQLLRDRTGPPPFPGWDEVVEKAGASYALLTAAAERTGKTG